MIYDKASLVQIPSGYKSGTLYSVVPNTADGDFTVTGDPQGEATRVNKDGLIESVAADVPRLNYDPSNPQDPHLLLEPSRTNLITQSQELTSGSLAKVNLTVADNTSIVDPQGNTNVKTLTATSASQPRLEWRGTAVPASNTSYAMSFWVRYNTARYVAIAHFSQTGEYAIFDLVDGEVENDVGTQTAKIEAYKNGWYRVSKSFEVPSTASINYWKFTLCTQTAPFTGVSGEKADVFGLQFEEGSYPSSYIPTSGLVVTRTADNCGDAGNSTIIKAEGSLFVNFTTSNTDNFKRISITDASDSNNNIFIQLLGTAFAVQVVSGGTTVYSWGFSITLSDRHKIALRYKDGDSQLYYNGTQQTATTTSGTWFTDGLLDTFSLNQGSFFNFYGEMYQTMLFNEALSDSELETLTS
jgi:hypothetical protein